VKTFWMFVYWMSFRNDGEFYRTSTVLDTSEGSQEGPIAGKFVHDGLPAAKLRVKLKDFDRDCFYFDRFIFVSEKMRRAMALGPADIQYFDVDADRSQSAPLPRSKHYQLTHIPVTEDVSDPEHSEYTLRHRPDGRELFGCPDAVAFRPGAEPAHEIFYDRFFRLTFCTDELALRVLWASCTGLRFVDPARLERGLGPYRTLRGVEEDDVWDPVRKIHTVALIREIP
jgi:hypothetical protein